MLTAGGIVGAVTQLALGLALSFGVSAIRKALAKRKQQQVQGRFILSINDVPEIRETFAGLTFYKAELTYSVGGGKGVGAKELIVVG